jgi:hypothetical protein
MDNPLQEAYEKAIYQINEPQIALQVGKANEALIELLQKKKAATWAIITAVNPGSVILDEADNQDRMKGLRKEVSPFLFLAGRALDPEGQWPAEENLLVLGIGKEEAIRLGRKWQQNAILFGRKEGKGELVWL